MWMAVAITAIIFAIGNILFGHFEERTPKWRRVTKVVLVLGMVAALSARFGWAWGLFPIALMLVGFFVVHLWWLPHRHGINGLTAEPKDRYYEFRGWNKRQ
jgi:fatty acid desaturase